MEVVLVDGGCGCCAVAGEVGVVTGTGGKGDGIAVEDGAVTSGGGDEMEGTTTADLVVESEVVVAFLKDPSCLLFRAVRAIFVGTS